VARKYAEESLLWMTEVILDVDNNTIAISSIIDLIRFYHLQRIEKFFVFVFF
jgi:hypothetical protein